MKHRILPFTFFSLLSLFCFLVFEPAYQGVDDMMYFDYTRSIVEDGDLNLVNQMYAPGAACEVTPTFNVPDFHNHGGIVLWTPFYLYGKMAHRIVRALGVPAPAVADEDYAEALSWSFSTVLFALGSLFFSFLVLRKFFSGGISCAALCAIFFGTPFFYYVLYQNGNANIIAALFGAIMVWFVVCIMEFRRSHLALLGLFFSICFAVKVDLWFAVFFIVPYLAFRAFQDKGKLPDLMFFFIGTVPGILLKVMNDYLKYGMFFSGELSMINTSRYFFWEQIFSAYHGFVYTSPILAVSAAGLFLSALGVLRKKSATAESFARDAVLVCLGIYLLAKVYLISYRFVWGGGTAGARILFSEFIVLSLLFARAFTFKNRLVMGSLYAVTCISLMWNMIVVGEFITGVDMEYLTNPVPLFSRVQSLAPVLQRVFSVKDPVNKLVFLSPLSLFLLLMAVFERKLIAGLRCRRPADFDGFSRALGFRYFRAFTLYTFTLYLLFSGLNLAYNRANVIRMRQSGFLSSCAVVGKKHFTFHENAASLDEIIFYYSARHRDDLIEKLGKIKESLY